MLADLSAHLVDEPESLIEGVHIFPLGGVAKTAEWTNTTLGRMPSEVRAVDFSVGAEA